jgi:hypothetical protein
MLVSMVISETGAVSFVDVLVRGHWCEIGVRW